MAALWLLLPALANFWIMLVLLFATSYILGYILAVKAGFSFGSLILLLSINILVALNPQEPVAFGMLVDDYLGLMIGITLGTVIGRLLWPILPQTILQRHLVRYFEGLRHLLDRFVYADSALASTMLLPTEALQCAEQMIFPGCPAKARADLVKFIRAVQPLAYQIAVLREPASQLSPDEPLESLRTSVQSLDIQIDRFLEQLARCFCQQEAVIGLPDLDAAVEALDLAVLSLRRNEARTEEDATTYWDAFALADRYHALVDRLATSRDHFARLHLPLYRGDFAL